jgi:hypothetical protein
MDFIERIFGISPTEAGAFEVLLFLIRSWASSSGERRRRNRR